MLTNLYDDFLKLFKKITLKQILIGSVILVLLYVVFFPVPMIEQFVDVSIECDDCLQMKPKLVYLLGNITNDTDTYPNTNEPLYILPSGTGTDDDSTIPFIRKKITDGATGTMKITKGALFDMFILFTDDDSSTTYITIDSDTSDGLPPNYTNSSSPSITELLEYNYLWARLDTTNDLLYQLSNGIDNKQMINSPLKGTIGNPFLFQNTQIPIYTRDEAGQSTSTSVTDIKIPFFTMSTSDLAQFQSTNSIISSTLPDTGFTSLSIENMNPAEFKFLYQLTLIFDRFRLNSHEGNRLAPSPIRNYN